MSGFLIIGYLTMFVMFATCFAVLLTGAVTCISNIIEYWLWDMLGV